MHTRRFAALAGIAAAGVAVGVAEAVAILTGATTSPLVSVGGVVIDAVPAKVKDFAVAVFYTYDKLALSIGTLVVLTAFAAGIGVLARQRRLWGYLGIGVFGVIGIAAALSRHNAPWYAFVPTLVGAAAGAGVLHWLFTLEAGDNADPEERRAFLRSAGYTLLGAAVLGFASRWWSTRRGVEADRANVQLPSVPPNTVAPLPPDADATLPDLAPFVTPNKDFYQIDTALVVPQLTTEDWKLRIYGRVEKELTISWDELLKRPMIERYITLACVSNEVGGNLISNAKWQGVRVADLLAEARPKAGADQVVSRSIDGFTAGTPTAALLDGRDAMLAIAMNGEPLPVEHGFPVRMVVPGLYGYVSATKWLVELELTSFADFDAYWIKRGWSAQGPIKTESRIDTPRDGSSPRAGEIMIGGVAWAQRRGISKVEIRVDDGPWQSATLLPVPSIDTWRQWTFKWPATPGKHRITVRATDNGGDTQTDAVAPPDPDGATGWHSIDVEVK
ncbi:sulfite oxidase [Dactylosporangium vinaceum]|uniref:Molybdopterin-dependent oxidoreductase n=1 Tax=Dactylosporangium vinaceum TaxID=53362 RepID=A0ABV5M587_9ACTN|nr:molybdopterin-dependent oxidoreductase [Dactylosporangium vinaceum]